MKSLQDYIETFESIASNLGYTGDSVTLLTHLFANAAYINEVSNISYVQESSLDTSKLLNSKIQRCVDNMYSVFRGRCPRAILNIRPTKKITLNLFDEVAISNNFKLFYLGYLSLNDEELTGLDGIKTPNTSEFTMAPLSVTPALTKNDTIQILCLMTSEFTDMEWTLTEGNNYYVDCIESNLSNDLWVKVNGEYKNTTREFSEHILKGSIFDLTLTDYGSRLYLPDIFRAEFKKEEEPAKENTSVVARFYKMCNLSDFSETELSKVKSPIGTLVDFDSEYNNGNYTGIYYIDSVPRHDSSTIHYKSNRDRYVNSIIRSNSDIGNILEEAFPGKIVHKGTSYKFGKNSEGDVELSIYYIPTSEKLTDKEIEDYRSNMTSYFVTNVINVTPGRLFKAIFNVSAELYQISSIDDEMSDIIFNYDNKFGINFEEEKDSIIALINKITNIRKVNSFDITFMDEGDNEVSWEEIIKEDPNLSQTYFNVSHSITTNIYTA